MNDETVEGRLASVAGRHSTILALAVVLTGRLAHAQAVPLQASDAQVTDEGNLQYSLTSLAAQPATAWSVTVLVEDANNTVVRRSVITVDEYRDDAQVDIVSGEVDGSFLRPKRTRQFEVTGPFDPRHLVSVTPAAMVLLDGGSAGDGALIESIFHRRSEERDARAEMLRQLLDVQARYAGPQALKEAIARLARLTTPDPGHARQVCQKSLREALMRLQPDDTDPTAELSRQIETLRREYAAAVRHATARKEH